MSENLKSTSRPYDSLRHRLQSSFVRRMYWAVAKRETLASMRREEDFYRNLLVDLRRDDLIFDIGANQGDKTAIFLKLGARVVSVEFNSRAAVLTGADSTRRRTGASSRSPLGSSR